MIRAECVPCNTMMTSFIYYIHSRKHPTSRNVAESSGYRIRKYIPIGQKEWCQEVHPNIKPKGIKVTEYLF